MAKKRDIVAEEDLMEAMIKVVNDPATPAESEFAGRVNLTLMTTYHHRDDALSIAVINETDRAQIESALAQFAHLRSKEGAPVGVKRRHAKHRPARELRDRNVIGYAMGLIENKRTDVLDKVVDKYGPDSEETFPLGRHRLARLVAAARRELKTTK